MEEKLRTRDQYIDKPGFGSENQLYDSKQQYEEAKSFFSKLNLKSSALEFQKVQCPICGHPKKIYCLTCNQLLHDKKDIPKIELPIQIRVVHHEKEKHQKSSILPIQFLSDQVKIFSFPMKESPNYGENDYILYPHSEGKLLSDLSLDEIRQMRSITAIDCTWRQTNQILKHFEQIEGWKRKYIKLGNYATYFWRYQHHGPKCLATVEAAYYFFKELSDIQKLELNCDILLHFYNIGFQLISTNLGEQNVYKKAEDKKQRRLTQKIAHKEKQMLKSQE